MLLLLLLLPGASALAVCRRTFCTSTIAAGAVIALEISAPPSFASTTTCSEAAEQICLPMDIAAPISSPTEIAASTSLPTHLVSLEKPQSVLSEAISGFVSGAAVSTAKQLLLHPLDTVKVRELQSH
jgi:hypothetical protein